jgi:hypothetical protein
VGAVDRRPYRFCVSWRVTREQVQHVGVVEPQRECNVANAQPVTDQPSDLGAYLFDIGRSMKLCALLVRVRVIGCLALDHSASIPFQVSRSAIRQFGP